MGGRDRVWVSVGRGLWLLQIWCDFIMAVVKCGGKQLNMHNSHPASRNTSVVDRNLGLTQFKTFNASSVSPVQLRAGGWKLERGNYNWNISNSEHCTAPCSVKEWGFLQAVGIYARSSSVQQRRGHLGAVSAVQAPVQAALLVKCGKIASDKKRKNISIFCRTMNVTLHFYVVFYNNTFLRKYFSISQ